MNQQQTTIPEPSLEILIIDDDKVGSFIEQHTMQKMANQWPTSVFRNGKTALEYLNQHPKEMGKYLVILDLKMPEMDGWEFLDACEATGKENIHSVILTSYATPENKSKALTYDRVIGFFEKPLDAVKVDKLLALEDLEEFFEEQGMK